VCAVCAVDGSSLLLGTAAANPTVSRSSYQCESSIAATTSQLAPFLGRLNIPGIHTSLNNISASREPIQPMRSLVHSSVVFLCATTSFVHARRPLLSTRNDLFCPCATTSFVHARLYRLVTHSNSRSAHYLLVSTPSCLLCVCVCAVRAQVDHPVSLCVVSRQWHSLTDVMHAYTHTHTHTQRGR
jgi:hypothetical protein